MTKNKRDSNINIKDFLKRTSNVTSFLKSYISAHNRNTSPHYQTHISLNDKKSFRTSTKNSLSSSHANDRPALQCSFAAGICLAKIVALLG